jgi:hypothetical protein
MIRRAFILALFVLAGCSGGSPTGEPPTVPSTILLPADSAPASTAMFIAELHGLTINQGNTWLAQVAVTVRDADNEPVEGVLVTGAWSEGDTETTACTTDQTGTCDQESDPIRKRVGQTVFEITGLEHGWREYRPDLGRVDSPEEEPRTIIIRKP